MSELFKRTNKFLKEFQENLNLEVSTLSFESSSDEYFNIDILKRKLNVCYGRVQVNIIL